MNHVSQYTVYIFEDERYLFLADFFSSYSRHITRLKFNDEL